jgi:hypothetical protein
MLIAATLGALSVALSCAEPGAAPAGRVAIADSSYVALFNEGVTFKSFLDSAKRRKEQWEKNYGRAVVPDALLTRARAATGPWKILVVAVDGCSDSVNTIPYLAKLVDKLMGVEMRIVGSDVGRWVMDAHKTPDGRGATPTVILLDGKDQLRGCFIERPKALQAWILGEKEKKSDDDVFTSKMSWYDDDKGGKTLEDFVGVMEGAAAGRMVCGDMSH